MHKFRTPQLPEVPVAVQHLQHLPLGPPEGKEDLGPWLDPEVPGPFIGPVQEDADGWARIDAFGVWECGLSSFRPLENVPLIHREKWARAMSIILRRLHTANTEEEEIRALKWPSSGSPGGVARRARATETSPPGLIVW